MTFKTAESAWASHIDGDCAEAYRLAKTIGFPAPIEALQYRARLLALYGTSPEALPAIGQYGAVAARQGELAHQLCAEFLAIIRVSERSLDDHIGRAKLLMSRLNPQTVAETSRLVSGLSASIQARFVERTSGLGIAS